MGRHEAPGPLRGRHVAGPSATRRHARGAFQPPPSRWPGSWGKAVPVTLILPTISDKPTISYAFPFAQPPAPKQGRHANPLE